MKKSLPIKSLLLALAATLYPLPGFAHGGHDDASKKVKKGKKQHAEHEESNFSFNIGVGVGVSKPLTPPPTATGSSANTSALKLDGGHGDSGGGGGDSSGGSQSASFSPYASAGINYKMTKSFSLGLSESFDLTGAGLGDPGASLTYSTPIAKKLAASFSLSATAPLSQASQKAFKITTGSVAAGVRKRIQKFSLGVQASVAMTWYSKTVIIDDDEHAGLVGPSSMMLHGDEDHSTEGGGTEASVPDGGTGNREFNRYSLKGLLGYQISGQFRADSGIGVSLVKKQFGDPYWSLDATILQISYGF